MGALKELLLASGIDDPHDPRAREIVRALSQTIPKGGEAMSAKPTQAQEGRDPIRERQLRAVEALLQGQWVLRPVTFLVKNGQGKTYVVTLDPTNPSCTCPDFEHRKVKCKHIWGVELALRAFMPHVLSAAVEDHGQQEDPQEVREAPQAQTAAPARGQKARENGQHPGRLKIHFGRYRGRYLGWIRKNDPEYLEWLATKWEPQADDAKAAAVKAAAQALAG